MKIAKAKFRNFAKFENFECEFDNQITRLVGLNGAGKSTVGLKGLMACIGGISEKNNGVSLLGERYRFIGKNGKSADVEYEFIDEKTGDKFAIRNHVTGSTNNITFQSLSGAHIDDSFLSNFLNVALMSAKNFCQLSGKDQALAIGINVSNFDKELKSLKDEFTIINRNLKAFGQIVAVEKVERIDYSTLSVKKADVRDMLNKKYLENKMHNDKLRTEYEAVMRRNDYARSQFKSEENDYKDLITRALSRLEDLVDWGYKGSEVKEWIDSIPAPKVPTYEPEIAPQYIQELPDDSELRAIEAQMDASVETNRKADEYDRYIDRKAQYDKLVSQLEANKKDQEVSIKARNDYMKSHSFGFAGLSIDDDGCLTLNNRPINESYYSKGELEMIVARLHASINPNFKCRFIDDFDLLDDANQEKLITELIEAGFQVITAEVGSKSEKNNVLVLRECAIYNGEEERKPELL